jgi:pentose-5-phosphate-3-epimerase
MQKKSNFSKESLNTLLQKPLKVLLLGETCRDEYHFGHVNRISPEAPVPVFDLQSCETKFGMANNVKNNLESFGCKVGISLNPGTHSSSVENLLELVDLILVMTVNPGFGGQSFIESQLPKIEAISQMIQKSGRNIALQVDGGITDITLPKVKKAGATHFVAGNFIFEAFKHDDFHERLIAKRKLFE